MKHSFPDSSAIQRIEVVDDLLYVSFTSNPVKSYEYTIANQDVFQQRITDCIVTKASIGKAYHAMKKEFIIAPTVN